MVRGLSMLLSTYKVGFGTFKAFELVQRCGGLITLQLEYTQYNSLNPTCCFNITYS